MVYQQQLVSDSSLVGFGVGNSLIDYAKQQSDGLALVKDISLQGRTLDRLHWLSLNQGINIEQVITKAIAHEFYLQTHTAILSSKFYEIESHIWQRELIFN